MSFTIQFLHAAEADLEEFAAYYESKRPGHGAVFHNRVARLVRRVTTSPRMYPRVRRRNDPR